MPVERQFKILFVINPFSGGKTSPNWEEEIRRYFNERQHSIEFFIMTGENDAESIRHWLESWKPQRVVAVGGDGTIALLARELRGTGLEMGILPAGSANGMAKELGIPVDPEAALEIIRTMESRKVDLISVNNEICLHLGDIGLNAKLIKYFEGGQRRGKWGYLQWVLRLLWRKQAIYVKVKTGDVELKRKAFCIVLANASRYGFGAVVNPVGRIDDGKFEVIIVRRLALSELFKMWFRPQPFNPRKIEILQAKEVEIESLHRVHFQVDGEYLGKVKMVRASIIPGALNLILPASFDS